jgi:hypothetical protein
MKMPSMLLVLCALWSPAAVAGPKIYSDDQLASDRARYAEKLHFLLEKGLLDFMSGDERAEVEGVVLEHKLRGSDPLDVKSLIAGGTPVIRAPVESLKFIEDLSVVYAWRYQNNYSLEPIDEYLAMLKFGSFKEGQPLDPITALGVPPRIWERDQRVGDLSLRFRNTAWAFILAHELGHLKFRHSLTPATAAEKQKQEEAADEFAIDLLSRSNTIPMGMILWFQATAGFFPNRSDFASDTAYFNWMRTEATHPVNGRRMQNLASIMQRQADAAADPNRADTLNYIATRLAAIGKIVEDPEMQSLLRRCAEKRRPEDLKRLDDRPCY